MEKCVRNVWNVKKWPNNCRMMNNWCLCPGWTDTAVGRRGSIALEILRQPNGSLRPGLRLGEVSRGRVSTTAARPRCSMPPPFGTACMLPLRNARYTFALINYTWGERPFLLHIDRGLYFLPFSIIRISLVVPGGQTLVLEAKRDRKITVRGILNHLRCTDVIHGLFPVRK